MPPPAPAPSFQHGQAPRVGILFTNLGTPDAATPAALRRYLAEFLSDSRVVEIPRLVWWPILHGIILRTRPAKSARKYASVWLPEGSPLLVWTQRQARELQAELAADGLPVIVVPAMRYGNPGIPAALQALHDRGVDRILVLPAYPQYSGATTASTIDKVAEWTRRTRRLPALRFVTQYHDDAGYIQALAASVCAHWQQAGRAPMLVMSFHGMPERTLHLGDPYHCQCHKTARLLAEALGLSTEQYRVTFQSRFGKAKWLEPATEPTLVALAQQGVAQVDVVCPGFSADCLETLEEISQEAREAFLHAGGQVFHYIPCLNDSPAHVAALAALARRHLAGWELDPPSPATLAATKARALAAGARA
ncbi:ferrochelatase [Ideonella azotifigens]|uniref:Ferrochelatase n=2 Tax=Ideonella azotifigens TaxID=513160 RepID=A0ABP3VFJ9_9BURK|nr:ferrochelatase [Ideonella azotifigens]MCD2343968.1 ferrochelatase [Ideonella azotifigens]